jgi:hypothetical protein
VEIVVEWDVVMVPFDEAVVVGGRIDGKVTVWLSAEVSGVEVVEGSDDVDVLVGLSVGVSVEEDSVEVSVEVFESVVVTTDWEVEVTALVANVVSVTVSVPPVVAGGGMTLKVVLAPHSERGVPLGQHPASVQKVPAGQYAVGIWD